MPSVSSCAWEPTRWGPLRSKKTDEEGEEVSTVVQPDILVVCDPDKLDEHGCCGAPDFIIEIVSPSTASKDNIKKTAIYQHHGVKEYWIVHPVDRLVFMRRLQEDGTYGKADIKSGEGTWSLAPRSSPFLLLGDPRTFFSATREPWQAISFFCSERVGKGERGFRRKNAAFWHYFVFASKTPSQSFGGVFSAKASQRALKVRDGPSSGTRDRAWPKWPRASSQPWLR